MSKTKFTPGPWIAQIQRSNKGEDLGWIVEHGNGRVGWASLAYADTNQEADKDDPARAANANLIAAAPELYDALEQFLEVWGSGDEIGPHHPALEYALNTLDKARGEL